MQMKLGIQYQKELQVENAQKTGFSNFEICYEDCDNIEVDKAIGIVLKLKDLTEDIFWKALEYGKKCDVEYIVLDTQEVPDEKNLYEIIENCGEAIKELGIALYIENGYKRQKNGTYCCSVFSEARELKRMVTNFNAMCDVDNFGVCLNVGYANLVEKNVKMMVAELADYIKVLHASDNDGRTNQHQMPCTFTVGRGAASTNWYGIIGTLIKNEFSGWIVFDTTGLIKRTPVQLQPAMLKLLWNLGQEWNNQFCLEEVLNQPEKKLILFGAGKMAQNYMESWGEKYPPAFLVDNSSSVWGKTAFGFEIKSPNAILEIPEQERNVWICNQYYDAVGRQLRDMGVEYQCFWDQYYL